MAKTLTEKPWNLPCLKGFSYWKKLGFLGCKLAKLKERVANNGVVLVRLREVNAPQIIIDNHIRGGKAIAELYRLRASGEVVGKGDL